MSPSRSPTSQCGYGFHGVRGGIVPGDLGFRPRVVRVAEIWKIFYLRVRPYPARVWQDIDIVPRGNARLRAGSMGPSQSTTISVGLGFPHRVG